MIAALVASVAAMFTPQADRPHQTGGPAHQVVVAPPPAPAEFLKQIQTIGAEFDGEAGIAVRDIQAGWTAAYKGDALFPQQSVSKLWVALATFEEVDKGRMRLEDQTLVRRQDLSVFHQPLRAKVGSDGYVATIDELLMGAIAKSDNAANDILMRRVGGGEAVQAVINEKRLGAIRAGTEERLLQAKIAGMNWRPEYSEGWSFQHARATLPDDYRKANLDAYLADPADGAAPAAIADALARLKKGQLLSPTSTARLLEIMSETETGRSRMRAGLAEGWSIQHKTGTGQELGARVTGWNDVGIITAPDGRSYAVAVMIAQTTTAGGNRNALFQKVARALVEHHIRTYLAPEPAADGGPART